MKLTNVPKVAAEGQGNPSARNVGYAFLSFFGKLPKTREASSRLFSGGMENLGFYYSDLAGKNHRSASEIINKSNPQLVESANSCIYYLKQAKPLLESALKYTKKSKRCFWLVSLAQTLLAKRYGAEQLHQEASAAWGKAGKFRALAGSATDYQFGMSKYHLAKYHEKNGDIALAAVVMKEAYELFNKAAELMKALEVGKEAAVLLHKAGKGFVACEVCDRLGQLAMFSGKLVKAMDFYLMAADYSPVSSMSIIFRQQAEECKEMNNNMMFAKEIAELRVSSVGI